MKRPVSIGSTVAFCALLTTGLALDADATPLNFVLDSYGSGNAGGSVGVVISDAGAGDVSISITNNTEGFITDLFLNYGTPGGLAGATIDNFQPTDGSVTEPVVRFKGLQGFAIDLAFQTGNSDAGRFGPGESVTFDLHPAAGALALGKFDVRGGNPFGAEYFAAVHVNGAKARGNCTDGTARLGDPNGANHPSPLAAIPCEVPSPVVQAPEVVGGANVPEPNALALLGMGAIGLLLTRRRSQR